MYSRYQYLGFLKQIVSSSQMIDHMERLILKGGPVAAGASVRTPRRGSDNPVAGMIGPRGSRSGRLTPKSGKSEKAINISVDSSGSHSSIKPSATEDFTAVVSSDTFDDPFLDQLTEAAAKNESEETDFFVERYRNNSLSFNSDDSDTGHAHTSDKIDYKNHPDALDLPRSTSLFREKSGASFNSFSPSEKAISGDSALLGISQMLSLLRTQVVKPKQSHASDSKTLEDLERSNSTPDSDLSTPKMRRGHSMFSRPNSRLSETSLTHEEEQLNELRPQTEKISRVSIGSVKSPDAKRAEQLELDLKLKNADNKFLQTELQKAQLQIEKKDKILHMLTDGLKEVHNFYLCLLQGKYYSSRKYSTGGNNAGSVTVFKRCVITRIRSSI